MTTLRMLRLSCAMLWSAGVVTSALAAPSPQQPAETAAQPASTMAARQETPLPRMEETMSMAMNGPFANPFVAFAPSSANEDRDPIGNAAAAAAAVPAAYPAAAPAPPSSSAWAPTHFEFYGDVQWRSLSSNGGFSSTFCTSTGCNPTDTENFSVNAGLTKWGVGPDFGFIWTPEKVILKAKSKVWVAWEQLDRSTTHNISGSFTFNGVTYGINTTLQTQLNTNLFSLGYVPQWGNDKFRIGPEIVYQHLGVDFILTNLTPGAPPPIKQSLNVPNNLAIIGFNFDFTPVQQLDVYGKSGWVPCCGGGYHINETEFGAKYYIRRNFSILGGFRYYWIKRDFSGSATVADITGTISGYLKFPGIGPFVGATYRF